MAFITRKYFGPSPFAGSPDSKRSGGVCSLRDEKEGYNVYPQARSNLPSIGSNRPSSRRHLPLRIPEVVLESPIEAPTLQDVSLDHSSSRPDSRDSPLFSHPVFSPSPTPTQVLSPSPTPSQAGPPFNLNRTPSLPDLNKTCDCDNPEPVMRRSKSLKTLFQECTKHGRNPSAGTCVCKFSPTVENATLMVMAGQPLRPVVVNHRSSTTPTNMSEAEDRPGSSMNWASPPAQNPSGRPRTPGRLAPNVGCQVSRPSSREQRVPNFYSQQGTAATRSTRSIYSSSSNFNARSVDISRIGSSRHDRLRWSLFRWSLVRLVSNIVLLAMSLAIVIVCIWPAIEHSPFPKTSFPYTPEPVSISQRSINGNVGPKVNTTSTKTESAQAKITTVYIPMSVDDLLSEGIHINKVGSATSKTHNKNSPSYATSANEKLKDPDGYFTLSPFWRTFHAEFRTHGFPALILGLTLLVLCQLGGNIFEVVCLAPSLQWSDEWASVKNSRGVLDVQSTARTWREWKRGPMWTGHRGQCVTAMRVQSLFAAVRAAYVVVVLVVVVCVAQGKASAGDPAL